MENIQSQGSEGRGWDAEIISNDLLRADVASNLANHYGSHDAGWDDIGMRAERNRLASEAATNFRGDDGKIVPGWRAIEISGLKEKEYARATYVSGRAGDLVFHVDDPSMVTLTRTSRMVNVTSVRKELLALMKEIPDAKIKYLFPGD